MSLSTISNKRTPLAIVPAACQLPQLGCPTSTTFVSLNSEKARYLQENPRLRHQRAKVLREQRRRFRPLYPAPSPFKGRDWPWSCASSGDSDHYFDLVMSIDSSIDPVSDGWSMLETLEDYYLPANSESNLSAYDSSVTGSGSSYNDVNHPSQQMAGPIYADTLRCEPAACDLSQYRYNDVDASMPLQYQRPFALTATSEVTSYYAHPGKDDVAAAPFVYPPLNAPTQLSQANLSMQSPTESSNANEKTRVGCKYCQKYFSDKHNKNRHENSSCTERPVGQKTRHTCPEADCGRKFHRSDSLTKHITSVHKKCSNCLKKHKGSIRFGSSDLVKQHKRDVHEIPDRSKSCSQGYAQS